MENLAAIEREFFEKRARVATKIFGDMSLVFAGVALSTNSPRMIAFLSLFALLLLAYLALKPYSRVFHLWREINHPLIQFRIVWRRFVHAFLGWSTLGMVALGIVSK